jgi:phage tail-like protein
VIDRDLTWWQLRDGDARLIAEAIEEMTRPVRLILDRFDDHLNPDLASPETVSWLSECFGFDLDAEPLHRQRLILRLLSHIFASWGTAQGLRLLLSAVIGCEVDDVELHENGASNASRTAGSVLPGSRTAYLHVRVRVNDLEKVDLIRLKQLLARAVPATVPFEVEVLFEPLR